MTDVPRHFMQFAFFKVDPAWRRLERTEREELKAEFADVVERWADRIVVRSYSSVGMRPDADLLIWRATPDLDLLHQMHVDLVGTQLGAWMDTTYLYTATTKDSQYMKSAAAVGFRKPKPLDVVPVDRKYMIVYPFVKQRRWYALPAEQRGAAMREHAEIGLNYPGVKLNTAYSFGLDDQEFMTAFETDSAQDFLDLMMDLRHSEASQYTERDTPIFTCLFAPIREALDALDGAATRVSIEA